MLTKETIKNCLDEGMTYDDIRELINKMEAHDLRVAEIEAEAKRERIEAAKEGLISAYACYLTEADIMTEAEVAQIDWNKFDTMLDEMAENVKAISKMVDRVKIVKVGKEEKEPDILSLLAKMGI